MEKGTRGTGMKPKVKTLHPTGKEGKWEKGTKEKQRKKQITIPASRRPEPERQQKQKVIQLTKDTVNVNEAADQSPRD